MRNNAFLFVVIFLFVLPGAVFSQVGINTDVPNSRAVLDLNSPTNDQGLRRIDSAFVHTFFKSLSKLGF